MVWGPLAARFLVTQIFGSVNEDDQVEHEEIWYEQYQVHRREHYWLLQVRKKIKLNTF